MPTAANMESFADCSAFVLLVNNGKLMVISNGMKFTSFFSRDYSAQTNKRIVNLIESIKIHDCDFFLISYVKLDNKINKSYLYLCVYRDACY